ncbi:MAG: succinyl-diaminopimelate desuccinylase [Xanthomonadales bacterium]|nr:succinyl-diaminopimelate desuccinylase [Xanthomonadales bacterium]
MTATLDLTRALIERPSLTPEDAGCQQLLVTRLEPLGFHARWLPFGPVSNLLLTHGDAAPSLWFLGHTDVVPPGPEDSWSSPPFAPTVNAEGELVGRGASDMKGAVAAMVVAMERFVQAHPQHRGQLGLLLTSDEEGVALDGIRKVAPQLASEQALPDSCLVGEPSSGARRGDTVRIGRRGSIVARLTVHGVQGHTAFPHTIDNPVHRLAPLLATLAAHEWDKGVDDADGSFPPTSCQVANLNAGTGASNVTPETATLTLSFRYNTNWNAQSLRAALEALIASHDLGRHTLDWHVSGEPFRSPAGPLRAALLGAVHEVLGEAPEQNTAGGTSDGRFLAPLGVEVVELGLRNATIHQIDERVDLNDLEQLTNVYEALIRRFFDPA